MTLDLDYRAIRKRVEAGVQRQKQIMRTTLFVVNLCMYIVLMLVGWGIFLGFGGAEASAALASGRSDSPLVGAMIVLSVAGFMGVLFQFITLMVETRRGEENMREKLLAREINRELLNLGLDESEETEKRKGMMRLTDDGELETLDDAAAADEEVLLKQSRK